MPNQIIDNDGAYLSTTFSGANGTWLLVGSESSGDSAYSKKPISWMATSVAQTIDEFKNTSSGERMTTTRIKVYKAAQSGAIHL